MNEITVMAMDNVDGFKEGEVFTANYNEFSESYVAFNGEGDKVYIADYDHEDDLIVDFDYQLLS